jgi:hypothetical protein
MPFKKIYIENESRRGEAVHAFGGKNFAESAEFVSKMHVPRQRSGSRSLLCTEVP